MSIKRLPRTLQYREELLGPPTGSYRYESYARTPTCSPPAARLPGPALSATGETRARGDACPPPSETPDALGAFACMRGHHQAKHHTTAHAYSMSADAVFGAEVIKVGEGAAGIERKKHGRRSWPWTSSCSVSRAGCETAGLG